MITREAIHHIPKSNYSYGYDNETLHFRIKTKKGEVKKAYVRIGDPYIWDKGGAGGGNLSASGTGWCAEDILMTKVCENELFDIFQAEFKPKYKRSRYAFILIGDDEKILFTEKSIKTLDGSINDDLILSTQGDFFCFPYLNNIDVIKIPSWVKDTVWYQIFPDRFCNGDPSLDEDYYDEWGAIPTSENFTGGDIRGVINKLDYLKDLGVSGIYFCPIFDASTNHRYDTIDYMKIDSRLGSEDDFRELVKKAHKMGMKIMLDAVFNHIGFYSPLFQDIVKNGENSKYKDWFVIKKFPVIDMELEDLDGRNLNYETFGTTFMMPKLNTENEEVIEYLISVGKYFVEEFNVDAWRLDVSNEVDHKFWRMFRDEIKKVKPDCYILGELWHDGLPWLMGDQFDSVMNYPLSDAIEKFICNNSINAKEFTYKVNNINLAYPTQVTEGIFNLVGSHDTPRILSLCGDVIEKAKLCYLLMFTQAGCPCIYYGDEIGINGMNKEGDIGLELNRKCMIWKKELQNLDMLSFMKKLIKIRNENSELKNVNNEWILSEDNLLILKKENLSVVVNNSSKSIEFNLPEYLQNSKVICLFDECEIGLGESLNLKGYEFLLLKEKI